MPVRSIPEIPFSDLLTRLRSDERRIPVEGTIETTFRCNLNCIHCYINEAAATHSVRRRELPLKRLHTLLDEIVDAGCLSLLFTGGEVLVRDDFPEVYLAAIRKGLLVTIFTNGTLILDRIADLFSEYLPERVEISLYGMTRETHERITRTPGSFDRCRAGIERLMNRGIPLKLKTMAMTWNMREIPAMQAYARRLGVDFVFDGLLNPRVDCGANRNAELQLSAEQVLVLDLQDSDRVRELRAFCQRFARPDISGTAEYVYTCGAGQTAFTIDPYGQLQMCQLSRRASFDIRKGTFEQGWNAVFPALRARKWHSASPCRTCSLISLCGSCPGAAELEHGDVEGLVAPFCRIAHARAYAVMGESCGHRRDGSCCLNSQTDSARTSTDAETDSISRILGTCPALATSAPLLVSPFENRPESWSSDSGSPE